MSEEEYKYLIAIFKCKESPGSNSPEFIQNIIYDKQLLEIYMRLTKQPLHSPVKEYINWLRTKRAKLCTNCDYKHKGRKIPSWLKSDFQANATLHNIKKMILSKS